MKLKSIIVPFILAPLLSLPQILLGEPTGEIDVFGKSLLEITADSTGLVPDTLVVDTTIFVDDLRFPRQFFQAPVYKPYQLKDSVDFFTDFTSTDEPALNWILRRKLLEATMNKVNNTLLFTNPDIVPYNLSKLPEPPKAYTATVDPSKSQIEIKEITVDKRSVTDNPKPIDIKRRYWLRSLETGLQFSQAYISPNWYQGGNNNLNMIANAVYKVQLNPAFNKNILFDNTISYKLAMNNAPDDTLHAYNISTDILQINTNFGLKAVKHWYYSITSQFKTQLLKNYKKNTRDMKAAFLSPGELNVGLGMTYTYTSPKKKFNFNASIAPLSYNLIVCTNPEVNETSFGIKEGKKTVSQYGSNLEAKLTWNMTYNITYTSRLYTFTDYDYIQGDWENTISLAVNKYLSTKIFVHLRYDSSAKSSVDSNWKKLQMKEILSFGLAYKFSMP